MADGFTTVRARLPDEIGVAVAAVPRWATNAVTGWTGFTGDRKWVAAAGQPWTDSIWIAPLTADEEERMLSWLDLKKRTAMGAADRPWRCTLLPMVTGFSAVLVTVDCRSEKMAWTSDLGRCYEWVLVVHCHEWVSDLPKIHG
ncbi:hypothetical protein ACLOJK_040948 [Asimina triloba]